MAQEKFMSINIDGVDVEVEALLTSSGAGDAGKLVGLDATGKFDPSVIPGVNITTALAFEAISGGDLISFNDDGGTAKMRRANALTQLEAHGFCPQAVLISTTGRVIMENAILVVAGPLVTGTKLFLSDSTPGGFSTTPITSSGSYLQRVGVVKSATEIAIDFRNPKIRA